MNRIDELFNRRKKNILSVFFTAGHPSPDSTTRIIRDLEQSGADMIEIGMPFSDPIADGPVIQGSSDKALRNGMSMNLLFKQLTDIRKTISIPLILMGYINPVLRYGVQNFSIKCAECGIDGIILPDLPPEVYFEDYSVFFENNDIYNIFLITPQVSEERIRLIDSISKGFIYMVSSYSTTGTKGSITDDQLQYFRRINEMKLKNPRLIGFGISDRKTFRIACENACGAIVGSAFVKMLDQTGGNSVDIQTFVGNLKDINEPPVNPLFFR
jgi:tryptophan synthase alpha chain